MANASARQIDVVNVVDGSSVGKLILIVVALCAGVSFLDGFDILAISYVAPVIGAAWKLPREAFGPIFAAHYIGAAAGSVFFGWYADRYGRRMGVIIPTAIFGVFALLTVYAYDFRSLFILRVLIGIGLGGALSNAIAMVAEYSPQRTRATLVSLMYAAFPLGGVIGGPISALLIAKYGWHAVFILGGVLPLLLTIGLLLWLNESIRFMVLSRAPAAQIGGILHRISPSFTPAAVGHLRAAAEPRRLEQTDARDLRARIRARHRAVVHRRLRRAIGDRLRRHLDAAGARFHRHAGDQRDPGVGGVLGRRHLRRHRPCPHHRQGQIVSRAGRSPSSCRRCRSPASASSPPTGTGCWRSPSSPGC